MSLYITNFGKGHRLFSLLRKSDKMSSSDEVEQPIIAGKPHVETKEMKAKSNEMVLVINIKNQLDSFFSSLPKPGFIGKAFTLLRRFHQEDYDDTYAQKQTSIPDSQLHRFVDDFLNIFPDRNTLFDSDVLNEAGMAFCNEIFGQIKNGIEKEGVYGQDQHGIALLKFRQKYPNSSMLSSTGVAQDAEQKEVKEQHVISDKDALRNEINQFARIFSEKLRGFNRLSEKYDLGFPKIGDQLDRELYQTLLSDKVKTLLSQKDDYQKAMIAGLMADIVMGVFRENPSLMETDIAAMGPWLLSACKAAKLVEEERQKTDDKTLRQALEQSEETNLNVSPAELILQAEHNVLKENNKFSRADDTLFCFGLGRSMKGKPTADLAKALTDNSNNKNIEENLTLKGKNGFAKHHWAVRRGIYDSIIFGVGLLLLCLSTFVPYLNIPLELVVAGFFLMGMMSEKKARPFSWVSAFCVAAIASKFLLPSLPAIYALVISGLAVSGVIIVWGYLMYKLYTSTSSSKDRPGIRKILLAVSMIFVSLIALCVMYLTLAGKLSILSNFLPIPHITITLWAFFAAACLVYAMFRGIDIIGGIIKKEGIFRELELASLDVELMGFKNKQQAMKASQTVNPKAEASTPTPVSSLSAASGPPGNDVEQGDKKGEFIPPAHTFSEVPKRLNASNSPLSTKIDPSMPNSQILAKPEIINPPDLPQRKGSWDLIIFNETGQHVLLAQSPLGSDATIAPVVLSTEGVITAIPVVPEGR